MQISLFFKIAVSINNYDVIEDFSVADGDLLQLELFSVYTVGASLAGLPSGTAIFSNHELLAVLQNINLDEGRNILENHRI